MIAPPGSTLWLLRHELRLGWRRMVTGKRRGRAWIMGISVAVLVLVMLAVGVPLGLALRGFEPRVEPAAVLLADLAVLVIFTLMLSQTLAGAIEGFYERADLDLLFSSPLDPRRVLTVRTLGVSLSVTIFFALFIVPMLIPVALIAHPPWLAAIIVLLSVGLAAGGAGVAVAGVLFRLLGARRTRTIAKVLAALIGAAFFLAAQLRNILGEQGTESFTQLVLARAQEPGYRPPPGADWPLRAMTGEPLPLLGVMAVAALIFLGANAWVGRRFASDAAAAAGVSGGRSRRAQGATRAFASGVFAVTVRKELRLLIRDPALLTQVLLQVLYLLPVGFLMLRNAGRREDLALAGGAAALVVMAAQVGGTLAWITVSAEDAPDLLACSPTPPRLLWRGKLAAAAIPTGLLLAPFLAALVVMDPGVGVLASLGCAASVGAAALVNLWWQRPGKRAEFQRARKGSWLVGIAQLVVSLLIAAAVGLFAAGMWWGVVPAILAALALLALRRSDAQIAAALRAAA